MRCEFCKALSLLRVYREGIVGMSSGCLESEERGRGRECAVFVELALGGSEKLWTRGREVKRAKERGTDVTGGYSSGGNREGGGCRTVVGWEVVWWLTSELSLDNLLEGWSLGVLMVCASLRILSGSHCLSGSHFSASGLWSIRFRESRSSSLLYE